MKRPAAPTFLDKRSYRERRMMDALRLLPVLAVLLWLLPLFWPSGETGAERVPLSAAITYVFGVWFLMILAAFGLSRFLRARLMAEIETTKPARED